MTYYYKTCKECKYNIGIYYKGYCRGCYLNNKFEKKEEETSMQGFTTEKTINDMWPNMYITTGRQQGRSFLNEQMLNSVYGVRSKAEYISHNNRNEKYFGIKKVIFNDPATIVFWNDGSKTVVKCQEGDIFDPEKGLAMAISKRAFGDKGNFNDVFKKWVPEPEPISVKELYEGIAKNFKRNLMDALINGDPKTYKKPEGEIKPIWESEDGKQ